jgi:hypothetical protein
MASVAEQLLEHGIQRGAIATATITLARNAPTSWGYRKDPACREDRSGAQCELSPLRLGNVAEREAPG